MAGMASEFAKQMGLKGAKALGPEGCKRRASHAAACRWAKVRGENPPDTAYTPAELCEALAGCLPANLDPYWSPRLADLLSALQ